jgi:hypothetical protein
MAPEAIVGMPNKDSDWYSLGATIASIVTNMECFNLDNVLSVEINIKKVPNEYKQLILNLTHKNNKKRKNTKFKSNSKKTNIWEKIVRSFYYDEEFENINLTEVKPTSKESTALIITKKLNDKTDAIYKFIKQDTKKKEKENLNNKDEITKFLEEKTKEIKELDEKYPHRRVMHDNYIDLHLPITKEMKITFPALKKGKPIFTKLKTAYIGKQLFVTNYENKEDCLLTLFLDNLKKVNLQKQYMYTDVINQVQNEIKKANDLYATVAEYQGEFRLIIENNTTLSDVLEKNHTQKYKCIQGDIKPTSIGEYNLKNITYKDYSYVMEKPKSIYHNKTVKVTELFRILSNSKLKETIIQELDKISTLYTGEELYILIMREELPLFDTHD